MKKIIRLFFKIAGFLALWLVLIVLYAAIPALDTPAFLGNNAALQRLWWELLPCLTAFLVTLLFTKGIEKGQISAGILGAPGKGLLLHVGLGLGLGAVWIGASAGILYLLGILRFSGPNVVSNMVLWWLAVLINAMMQECLLRGYIFQLLQKEANTLVATVVTNLIFIAMHAGAFEAGPLAVLNVAAMSLLMTLLLLYTGNLLAPIAAHFLWNGVGCLLLGGVFLAEDYPSLYSATLSGSSLLSGGSAGMEGSVVVLCISCLLMLGIFLRMQALRGRRRQQSVG